MNKQRLLTGTAATLVALSALANMPVMAQTGGQAAPVAPPAAQIADPNAPAAQTQDIVVTGTLIRGSRENAAAPVQVISSEELANRGSPSTLDLIKDLPSSSGVIGDANQFDSRSQGSEGVASVNLRGLGPQRTLVLLNGKRLSNNAVGPGNVDVNLLPTGAIERVEVLKDGAAATYGSDAVAGVVNFITRSNQQGFLASGDYRYIPGSDGDYNGAVSYGHHANGFQVLASFGYQHRSELRTRDRDFTVQPYTVNPQGGYTSGGNPGNYDFNATVGGVNFTADQGCTTLGGFRALPGSTSDRCYNGFNQFNNLVEPENRYQAYLETKVDLTSTISVSATALYGHSSSRLTTSPSYLPTLPPSSNAVSGGAGLFVVPTYAPALRDYCALYGATSGCTIAGGNPVAPAIAFPVLFRPLGSGGNPLFTDRDDRGSAFSPRTSDAIRFTGGLNWQISPALNLDAGATYSEYDRQYEGTDTFGDLLQNAFAGFGGANCAFATPASRAGLTTAQIAALAGTNGCTFFNPFSTGVAANINSGQVNPTYAGTRSPAGFSLMPGAGLINDPGTIDNFFRTTRTDVNTKLYVGEVVLSGRSGLTLPGGDLTFAIGGQYRKNDYAIRYNNDSNLAVNPCPGSPLNPAAICNPQTGALGFLGSGFNRSVSNDIYAIFWEIRAPITSKLDIQFSARYEDYGGSVGSTFNPQGRLRYQVTDWLAVRGGGGTTFRGPPPQQVTGNITTLQLIGSAFRAVDVFGNPNINPEDATTYSGGILVDKGPFTASVDYYRYELHGPIDNEPVAGIVSALFGASGAANCGNPAYAGLRSRFTFTSAGCGIGNVTRLRTNTFNSGDVTTSGIDVQALFKFDLGSGQIGIGGAGTYVIDYKTKDILVEGIVVQPRFDAVGKFNLQTSAYPLPQIKGNLYVQGHYGIQNARLQFNYIDGYTDQRGAAVFGPNTGALAGASTTAGKNIGSFNTFDFTYRIALPTDTTISLSVLNLLDKDPPFARYNVNYDPFTASPLGITAKFGVAQKF